jgi:hypothetical protein
MILKLKTFTLQKHLLRDWKEEIGMDIVVHVYNTSYSGGRDSLRLTWIKA